MELLDSYSRAAVERGDDRKKRLAKLRIEHGEAEAGISRLLELVEKGVMAAEDQSLRERLIALKLQRDELAKEIADLARNIASDDPAIAPEKVERLATLLHDKLNRGPAEFRQAYARLVLREVSVKDREIGISGSKALLARAAADGLQPTPPAVFSFVREWRARKDSNL